MRQVPLQPLPTMRKVALLRTLPRKKPSQPPKKTPHPSLKKKNTSPSPPIIIQNLTYRLSPGHLRPRRHPADPLPGSQHSRRQRRASYHRAVRMRESPARECHPAVGRRRCSHPVGYLPGRRQGRGVDDARLAGLLDVLHVARRLGLRLVDVGLTRRPDSRDRRPGQRCSCR